MNIETNGIKVDSSQLDVVEKFAQELQEFLALWDISHESTNRETARKIAATNANTVFSLIPDWDTNGGYWLSPGFFEAADDYFLSKRAFDSSERRAPYTEIHLECVKCSGEGVDGDDDCENCDGEGRIIVDFSWDYEGKVQAEAVAG